HANLQCSARELAIELVVIVCASGYGHLRIPDRLTSKAVRITASATRNSGPDLAIVDRDSKAPASEIVALHRRTTLQERALLAFANRLRAGAAMRGYDHSMCTR